MVNPLVLMTLLTLGWVGRCGAFSREAELRLVKDFTDRYAPFGKASAFFQSPVRVYVSLSLMSVLRLEERDQSLLSSVLMTVTWWDSRMTWNASQFEDINHLIVSQETVWKPDLFLENTMDVFPLPRSDEGDSVVSVRSSGRLSWLVPAVLQSKCKVNVAKFPFDTQVCHLNFSSFTYPKSVLNISTPGSGVSLYYFIPNSEWHLVNFSLADWQPIDTVPRVVYRLELKRRSTFHVIKLVVPTIILAVINCFVMLVPEDSGERRSISLTIMLAWTVFLSFVDADTPPNSDNVPYIALFVVLHMIISALTCVLTMLPACGADRGQAEYALDSVLPDQNHSQDTEVIKGAGGPRCCWATRCGANSLNYVFFVIIVAVSLANTIWYLVAVLA